MIKGCWELVVRFVDGGRVVVGVVKGNATPIHAPERQQSRK